MRERLVTVPVLPTLLTAGNLACGVTAVFCAASNQALFLYGAILIFVAMVCDMFDGKVARMTGQAGPFGAQLDSLADVVSFGAAPAILVHRLVLGDHPDKVWGEGEKLIWAIAVLYVVFTAIRLARYNVEHAEDGGGEETTAFIGLPSPGAAAFLACWVLFYAWYLDPANSANYAGSLMDRAGWQREVVAQLVRLFLSAATPLCALLMVSRIRFPHIGNTLLGRSMGLRRFLLLLLVLVLLITLKLYAVVVVVTGYVALGVVPAIPGLLSRWRAGRDILEEDEAGS
ncbi:MAG: CDP-alcohol phosphatidyltransferase family protein [Planctomycetota bacterium]